jgi:hypothetical protein
MPFTPFHFGPGILLKAAAPKHASLAGFVVAQLLVDLETIYHLSRGDWPVHRQLHSMIGGSVAGLVAAALLVSVRSAFRRLLARIVGADVVIRPGISAEAEAKPLLLGGWWAA